MMEWVLSSCLLILVVLVLRAALGKRISAGLRYGLWAVVLVRLLFPVSFLALPAAVPQLPAWEPPETMMEESIYVLPIDSTPVKGSGAAMQDDGTIMDAGSFGYSRLENDGEKVVRYADKVSPLELLGWVWFAGAAALGAALIAANLRFTIRLRRVRKPLDGTSAPIPVYVASGLPSPCLMGVLRPAVYVTAETANDPAMLRHVLAHELTHYNHLDHIWSVLRGAALAVHWWNPLVWLAVVCSRRDGELACDEGALRHLGDAERMAYGETLLALVTAKSRPGDLFCFATTMSGGKRSLRERIQRIACQPKRLVSAMVVVVAALVLSSVVAFGQAKETPDTPLDNEASAVSSTPDGAWRNAEITLDENGVPHILYTYPDGSSDVKGEPIPAPHEWADDDLAGRNEATALMYSPDVWAKLVSETDGWLVACYERGVAAADTYVYKTEDGGMTWTEVEMPWTSWHIADVGFINSDRLIVAQRLFDSAPCLITKDGGQSWEEIEHPDAVVTEIRVGSILTMYVGANESDPATYMMTSVDFGDSWTVTSLEPSGFEEADLTHNGQMETLCWRSDDTWNLQVYSSDGDTLIWEEDELTEILGIDWKALFLCHIDGADYLLRYTPHVSFAEGGGCDYIYQLFYLTEDGESVVTAQNMVRFDLNFDPDYADQHHFDPQEISDFMDEVNGLMASGPLLRSIDPNLSQTFRREERWCDSLWWLDQTRDENLSLLENLQNYAAYAQDHPDDIWSPLAELLENLTPDGIGDISSQSEVTSAQLVELLQKTSSLRSSRYHTYHTFAEEEAWEWSLAEWAVPLTDGGTLYLLACDSGRVEMSYETADGATSAFYGQSKKLHDLILKAGTIYPQKVLPYAPDLDRDGTPDELILRSESDDGTAWSLQCDLSSGNTWRTEASTDHSGWNALFLCQMDGEDYLLQYVPYFAGMAGDYRYKLFYLDQDHAREVIVQENSLKFQLSTGNTIITPSGDPVFADTAPEEIAAFMEEINALLADSTQLLNTDQYLRSVFEREGRLYDSMFFVQVKETWDADKTLLENLLIYRNQVVADAAISEVYKIYHITEDDIVSAVRTDGVSISKAALAEAMQVQPISYRSLETDDWEPQYPAIEVAYTIPGDPGQQSLTLEAGTSEGKKLVRAAFEGQKTVLMYSENPDNDATYLHDVPYSLVGYISTSRIYDLIVGLSK